MESVIKVEGLSKRYRIGTKESKSGTFVHQVVEMIKSPINNFRRLSRLGNFTDEEDDSIFWALRDVNFEVNRGDVIGVIGRNGAGKSTLLKVLSRITEPTAGTISLSGRVASLLEVGTGFHPELTGRENVFMNGTILGMRRGEVAAKFDEIVDFSGVEKFIDTPVKFYSSGMKVRLGFAVAANLEPDILIVDEVLAVGDFEFQKKCMGKMDRVAHEDGRTILFVSHSIPAIKALCSKGLLLEQGQLQFFGSVADTVNRYFKNTTSDEGEFYPGKIGATERVVISKVSLENQMGQQTEHFNVGDDLIVNVELESEEEFKHPNMFIAIKAGMNAISVANTMFDGSRTGQLRIGKNFVRCSFKNIPLLPREYSVSIGVRAQDAKTMLTVSKDVAYFAVVTRMRDLGIVTPSAEMAAADSASPFIPYIWKFGNDREQYFNITDRSKRTPSNA